MAITSGAGPTGKKKPVIPKEPTRGRKKPTRASTQEKANLEGLIRHDKMRRGLFTGKK